MRARQVLDDLPADAAHRLAPALGGHRAACGGADVVLGDPPTRPGRRHRCELDAELLRDAPHERRRLHLAALARSDRSRDSPWDTAVVGASATGVAPSSSAPITTSTVPTGAISPSATRMRETRPAAGEGISTVVLSVWISTSGCVLGDLVADRDEPARHLALGQPLAEVGQLERVRHGGGAYRRGRPTQALGGTSRMRRPSPARQSETACSSPASSAATSRGT